MFGKSSLSSCLKLNYEIVHWIFNKNLYTRTTWQTYFRLIAQKSCQNHITRLKQQKWTFLSSNDCRKLQPFQISWISQLPKFLVWMPEEDKQGKVFDVAKYWSKRKLKQICFTQWTMKIRKRWKIACIRGKVLCLFSLSERRSNAINPWI